MQDGNTADMIHSVPALVSFISRHITLEPGDLIATGTPAGVGVFRDPPVFLEPGDRVRCEIEGIGMVEIGCRLDRGHPAGTLVRELGRAPERGSRACSPW